MNSVYFQQFYFLTNPLDLPNATCVIGINKGAATKHAQYLNTQVSLEKEIADLNGIFHLVK